MCSRRVRERDAGRKIRLFKLIKAGPRVSRSSKSERDQRGGVVPNTLMHNLSVVRELSAQIVGPRGASAGVDAGIASWRRLESVHLPGRREQRPTHPIGDGQVGLLPPRILAVKLVPVKPVLPSYRNARSQQ